MVGNVTSELNHSGWAGNEWLQMSNEQSNHIARECLKTAVMQMLTEKPLENISITELVKKAGVSRSAFYRNYASKEDLIEDVCRQIVDEIIAILKAPLHREDRAKWFAQFFYSVKKNEQYFRVYLDTHMQLMRSSILENVCPSENTEEHYRLIVREGAFANVLTDWFRNGMKEDPDEMGELCDKIIPHGKYSGQDFPVDLRI